MKIKSSILFLAAALALCVSSAQATLISLGACVGPVSCIITTTPPNPVAADPNDGILLAWDEVQNFTLTADLQVDRVFDTSAPFVKQVGSNLFIKAGTIVSSHYLQWDGAPGGNGTVQTTVSADSQIFAFITSDSNLLASDFLGKPGITYNHFSLRGLESGDVTNFNGTAVDIDWTATTPGDWGRLITAFSPAAAIPEPGSLSLLGLGLLAAAYNIRRRRSTRD